MLWTRRHQTDSLRQSRTIRGVADRLLDLVAQAVDLGEVFAGFFHALIVAKQAAQSFGLLQVDQPLVHRSEHVRDASHLDKVLYEDVVDQLSAQVLHVFERGEL